MKRIVYVLIIGSFFGLTSCNELNLNPLSEGSSENWYSNETEIEMAIKDFYRDDFWPLDNEDKTDNFVYRETLSATLNGTFNGQNSDVTTLWANQYKAIARANTILANMDKAAASGISPVKIAQYEAEALFARASMYARLVTYFGDVVYVTEVIDIDEAFTIGRTPKSEIVPKIYADYDLAIAGLPVSYGAGALRATKGAALALKARFAMNMSDWAVAAEAAKACMDLSVYQLHPDFAGLFLSTTKNSTESIFYLVRSVENKVTLGNWIVMNELPRNTGGWGAFAPSWELFASFTCTDGLPIDESPLFDPRNPFKNRDPRCTATIVEFETRHVGFDYNPHPSAKQVMNYNTGKMQTNNDARVNAQYASFNGLLWKKRIDESWLLNGKDTDPDKIIIRYADVLLMYAEAKMELGQIDQTVLDAVNAVRARAYKVAPSATDEYPAVTTTSQTELRKIIRNERRVEFANEGLRYMDIVRWKLATKALTRKNYGMLYPVSLLQEKIVDQGLWFWPMTPEIDDDGLSDFTPMEKAGLITPLSQRLWNDRQYLWPIPSKEILINENMKQNPGY